MSHEEMNVVPDVAQHAMPVEEYKKFWEKIAAELPATPTEDDHQQTRDTVWAENDPDVRRQYGGQYVAVHKARVLAAGRDLGVVYAEAERVSGLPRHQIAIVPIPDHLIFQGN